MEFCVQFKQKMWAEVTGKILDWKKKEEKDVPIKNFGVHLMCLWH